MEEDRDLFHLDQVDVPVHFGSLSFANLIELVVLNAESEELPPLPPPAASFVQVASAGFSQDGHTPHFDEPDFKAQLSTSDKDTDLPLMVSESSREPSSTPLPRAKVDYYPCFVNIISPSSSLCTDLEESILRLFGIPLMFHISNGAAKDAEALDEPLVPRFVIQLRMKMGLPGTNDRYQKLMKKLEAESWQKVKRATHKLQSTQLFVHRLCPSVGFGIELTEISSSVKFILSVSSKEMMTPTVNFYKSLLNSSSTDNPNNVIYPLGKLCDFEVRHHDEVPVTPVSSAASLCFRLQSRSHLTDIPQSSRTGWHTYTDPDGNTVNLKITN